MAQLSLYLSSDDYRSCCGLSRCTRRQREDNESGEENALLATERAWFAKRLCEGLTRTCGVLRALKKDALGDGDDNNLERLAQLTSLWAVMEALPGVNGERFCS